MPKKAKMLAKKKPAQASKPPPPTKGAQQASKASTKSKTSVLSCCRKKKPKPTVRPQIPPPRGPVAVKPRTAVAVPAAKPRTRTLKKAVEKPTVKRATSVPSLRVEKSPVKSVAKKEDDRFKKRRLKTPIVTSLVRNMENKELIYRTQELHVFSVMHKDRMITRWKCRDTKPQNGCPPPKMKSRYAILLATGRAKHSGDEIPPRQRKKDLSDCTFGNKKIRLIHKHREGYGDSTISSSVTSTPSGIRHQCTKNVARSFPSINSFSDSSDDKPKARRFVTRFGKTNKTKNGQGSSTSLSAETNVEFPSPRRHPFAVKPVARNQMDSETDRKKLDVALTACENSVHRVGKTLKGLKTLAGQQLIPGVDNFQNEIDKMFVDMDRMLEWITLLSEKKDGK